MTTFRYEAAREDGARVRGTIEAATVPDASGVLSARGLYPMAVENARAPAPWLATWRRPSVKAQATVFQSLHSLVDAGVPLYPALRSTERIATGQLREAVVRVASRVREGRSLGAALVAEGSTFSPVAVGLVRAGERGVGLGAALEQAAVHLEREAETAARIRAALAYPALLAAVGGTSIALITIFVVPRFAAILGDLGQSLPLATRVLVGASELARQYGLILGAFVVGIAVAATRLIADQRVRWDGWLLTLPLIGEIRHGLATARAARTLGSLLGAGTPALVALDVTRDSVGDAAVAERLLAAKARVAEGWPLARGLDVTAAFTPTALQLSAIGDQSGRVAALLSRAADLEEREADRRLKTLVSFLEPALILAFAGLVGFVAAALLQAVYALRPSV